MMVYCRCLNQFDAAMNHMEEEQGWLNQEPAYVSTKHEGDKIIVFERGNCVFCFNFHPTESFADYKIGVEVEGEYRQRLIICLIYLNSFGCVYVRMFVHM